MRKLNILAAVVFVSAIAAIVGFELASSEYEFIPEEPSRDAIDYSPPASSGPSEELIARFSRTTGSLDPGNAEVNVIFLNPIREMPGDNLYFQIMVNTANLDLPEYEIAKMVSLEDDNGKNAIDGFEWETLHTIRNHHIMGILTAPDLSWLKYSFKEAEYLKLTIEGIPNIDKREFRWNKSVS